MSYEQIEQAVNEWAAEKGIHDNSSPLKQFEKTMEECLELHEAMIRYYAERYLWQSEYDEAEATHAIKDAIGDIQVTLQNIAHFYDLTNSECFAHAYNVISSRTGKMENGVFVKDA